MHVCMHALVENLKNLAWPSYNRGVIVKTVAMLMGKTTSSSNLIDIGCGAGAYLASFRAFRRFRDSGLVGIDISKERLAIVKKNWSDNFVLATAKNPPFKDDLFKGVLMKHFLHHVGKPLECLKEVKRISKRESDIVIVEGNRLNFINLLYTKYRLDNHYTLEGLLTLCKLSQLKPNEVRQIYVYPYVPLFRSRNPIMILWNISTVIMITISSFPLLTKLVSTFLAMVNNLFRMEPSFNIIHIASYTGD